MTRPLHLLIIEDSEDDAQLMARTIQRGGFDVQYERVETESALQASLRLDGWDLVLCDYTLPALNALKALELVKESGRDLPLIIVSGTIGEEMAIAALRGGASDFMLKGNLARLVPAIQRELQDAATRRERRAAEEALRRAETQFRTLIEQLPMIVYVTASNDVSRTTYVSPQVYAMLGYTTQEWLKEPMSWQDAIHPDDRQRVLEAVERSNRTGAPFDMEYRMLARDGRVIWFRDQAEPVRDSSGQSLYWQGLMIDVTQKRQQEREQEAIARLSQALRQTQTVSDILPPLLDETLALMDTDQGSVWLRDGLNGKIGLAEQRHWEGEALRTFPQASGILEAVIQKGQTVVVRELQSDEAIPEDLRQRMPPGIGIACVPLAAASESLGAVFVSLRLPREITPAELRVLSALADLGASALHRAQLFDETVKHLDRLAALRSIDVAISSSFDLRMILNVVLGNVVRQLHVDAASILLLRPDSLLLEFAAGQGFWTRAIEVSALAVGEGLPGKAVLERDITAVPDLHGSTDARTRPYLLADEKFVSYYAIPLVAKGKVKGILEVFHRSRLEPDAEWLQFLEALGGQAAIAIDSSGTFQDLQRSNRELALAYDATMEGWSRALDLRDRDTEGHTERVTELAVRLGRAMGMDDEALVQLRRGGLLHDIGKVAVPDSILHKPDRLDPEEWAIMRRHPQLAFDMLSPIPYLRPALDIPYSHHERWDGRGYPRGLKGQEIPFAARVFAVVDVWDALLVDRPYRPARRPAEVLRYIEEGSGTHFDPAVVEAFVRLVTEEGVLAAIP
jgi:PAS domain S-box-containing protein